MATLELKAVRKTYDNRTAVLHGIDLTAADGEFIVLVGPSGCGKSTLLRMIAGLEDISGGDVFIAGKRVNDLAPSERDIAMVFQDYALYPHMSVRENLSFGLKIRKVAKSEITTRVEAASKTLSIDHLLDRRPSQLSGGQRQRVAIGRAIVRNPSIFLFDEPLSNLDAQLRAQTRIEIASLHQKMKTTIVYVTHDQVEAMTLASRIVVLDKGRVQQVGTPLELYNAPANRFVASFIGNPSMNFFPGELVVDGARRIFRFDGVTVDLSDAPTPATPGRYVLGVRPEGLKVLAREGRESQGSVDLEPKVVLLEPHGHESHLVALVGAGAAAGAAARQVIIRSANPKRLAVMESSRPGQLLSVTLDRAALHWFAESDGGERMVVRQPIK